MIAMTEQKKFLDFHDRLRMLIKETEMIHSRFEALDLPGELYESLYSILQNLDLALDTNSKIANPADLVLLEDWLIEAFLESFELLFQSLLNEDENETAYL